MRLSPLKLVALAAAAVLAVGLAALHFGGYPLPYVYTVLVDQDADFDDIHQFPFRAIAAPPGAVELPLEADPRVAEVLAQHPDVDDLDTLLDETDTTAFLVVHRGRLVEERYLHGHDRTSVQNTFSVAKSVTSALVGLAVRDGRIELDAPITRYLPELGERDGGFSKITVKHLLDMRSGIRFSGDVTFPIVTCDNPLIYYHPDLESVALGRTGIESAPGEFRYNNYNPVLLGIILRRATGMPVGEYLERELWTPLGAEAEAGWTTDERGQERMESSFFARGRDIARFGMLYLGRGRAGGRQVLPEEWVLQTTGLPEPVELETYDGRRWGYGGGWWIVPRPAGRPDFAAIGRFGQFIYVSPQYDVVFVRNGTDRGEWGDRDWTALFYFTAQRLEPLLLAPQGGQG